MEFFLTAEEVIEKHINKSSLIFAFLSGELIAYEKNSFEPINGKELFDFFKHFQNVFYLEGGTFFREEEHPYYQEDKYCEHNRIEFRNGCWTDRTTKLKYTASTPQSTLERVPWLHLYKEMKYEMELSSNNHLYFEESNSYPIVICGDQIDEIQDGWGSAQAKEIILDSLFKLSDLQQLSLNINKSIGDVTDNIGDSERETWLKIILLLSYSLAIEMRNDEEWDLLNKKGKNKINPNKLAGWLKIKAGEMFPGKDNPGHRCGKTTIDKILQEAEEILSPDIHAFLSPQE